MYGKKYELIAFLLVIFLFSHSSTAPLIFLACFFHILHNSLDFMVHQHSSNSARLRLKDGV